MPRPYSCSALPPTVSPPATTPTNHVDSLAAKTAMRMLQKITRIELTDFQRIDGVKYYVLNVYEKPSRQRTGAGSVSPSPSSRRSNGGARRLGPFATRGVPFTDPATDDPRKPAYRVIKRFRDFEALRKQLQRCFATTQSGECSCCDAYTTFLACGSMQPSLLVKWLKRESARKQLLEQYINQLVRLAVMATSRTSHGQKEDGAVCHAKHDVPWSLQQFMTASSAQKTKKSTEGDDRVATRNSIATASVF